MTDYPMTDMYNTYLVHVNMWKFDLQPISSRSLAGLLTPTSQPFSQHCWILVFLNPLLLVVGFGIAINLKEVTGFKS